MEHPNLTADETAVVEHARAHLSAELLRRRIPAERWAHVTLGVVVDLAGQTLRLVDHDTEPPPAPAPALCNRGSFDSSGVTMPTRLILHCTLAAGHGGDCIPEVHP